VTVACLLPAMRLSAALLEPCLQALRARYRDSRLTFFCARQDLDHYSAMLDPGGVSDLAEFGGRADRCVALTFHMWPRGEEFDPPHVRPLTQMVGAGQAVALLNLHGHFLEGTVVDGRVILGGRDVLERVAPRHADHVFGRLGPCGAGYLDLYSFVYFPYGYVMRAAGVGVVDGMGFRVPADHHRLAERDPGHVLIVVLGGSSAFSLYCDDESMFSAALERRLSAAPELNERGVRVSVLNFGVPGQVVLNQTLTYLLFVEKLRPDFVIGHDGINDCHYGLITDPALLRHDQITYPDNLEKWAQLLHGSADRPTTQSAYEGSGHLRSINSVAEVARAYVSRKRQLKRVVEAGGARLVWGLQPAFFSKGALSEREEYGIANYIGHLHRDQAALLPELFRMLSDHVEHAPHDIVVDLHRHFRRFGADRTLFADHVHMLPAGDAEVAEAYASALCPVITRDRMRTGK
jgi:hypothetical protein